MPAAAPRSVQGTLRDGRGKKKRRGETAFTASATPHAAETGSAHAIRISTKTHGLFVLAAPSVARMTPTPIAYTSDSPKTYQRMRGLSLRAGFQGMRAERGRQSTVRRHGRWRQGDVPHHQPARRKAAAAPG